MLKIMNLTIRISDVDRLFQTPRPNSEKTGHIHAHTSLGMFFVSCAFWLQVVRFASTENVTGYYSDYAGAVSYS